LSKTYKSTVPVAAAALIAGSVFVARSVRSTDPEASRQQTTTIPFASRFPQAAELGAGLSEAGWQLRLAKARLAEALRTQTQTQTPEPMVTNGETGAQQSKDKVPLPRIRPLTSVRMANLTSAPGAERDPPSNPLSNISTAVRKVFAMLQPSDTRAASPSLEGGVLGDGHGASPLAGMRQTAVYDIKARTVYMPDGTRLEAHSGLGDLTDDPSHVDIRDRGATPPQVYELTLRESRFHGVEALRMKPVGEGELFGRTGLLAHSYMMGPKGDSNGCVSFKDYDAFLKAYKNGDVRRLVVVPSLAS
jgi:type VI secretion system (T6SS) effector TldE1-like protein